jgi:glycosyltransferase involved in cell wall biosynthesis
MRIVLFTSSTTPSGGSRQALYLAQGLLKRGYDVRFHIPESSTLQELDPAFPYFHLPEKRKDWRAVIEKSLDGREATIVHSFHNKPMKLLSKWGILWRLRKLPVVTLAHRGVIFRPNNPLPYLSPGIDAFTVNSKAVGDKIAKVGAPRRKIRVLYNGIPDERVTPNVAKEDVYAELTISPEETVLLSVAGNNPVKGVEQLLRAYAAAKPKARLIVVGADMERWGAVHTELGLGEDVMLIGRREHPADYLQIAKGFVLPSYDMESMPNTMLEALCAGLPVIAGDVGGVKEILRDNGLLVPPKNIEALAIALQDFLSDETRIEEWAAASRALGKEFSMCGKIDKALDLYTDLLQARGLGGHK